MTPRKHDLPSLASCVAQLISDIRVLPEVRQSELVAALHEEETAMPLEALGRHLREKPGRMPHYAALVVREMPYYIVLRHLEGVDGLGLFKKHADDILECLGEARGYFSFAALMYLQGGERMGRESFEPTSGPEVGALPMPDALKLAALDEKMSKELIPIGSLLIRDDHRAILAAQMRATKAEQDLKDAQVKWAKTQERMIAEAQRAKAKAAEQAHCTADKAIRAELDAARKRVEAEVEAHQITKGRLDAAKERLKEIEEQGGATPARVEEIRKEIQHEADQRIEDELSVAVRPWLVQMVEMEQGRRAMGVAQSLSSRALAKAKEEAEASDILVNWDRDREKALKVLEREMTELDALMQRVIKPSKELSDLHGELLRAMFTCRQRLNPDKPLGEVAKALISGLKKVKDEDLGEAAYAVRKLAEKGVFLGLEGETLLKIVEGEKQKRYDLTHFKKSVQGRMIARLHAGEPVDILIDGYNFMFTANQHFGDSLKLNKNAAGEAVFGELGRAKLVKILSPLAEKFPCLQINLFFDGLVKENKKPQERIMLWEPTYQRSGKGQADAEIAHVGLKRIRKGAMAVVVSNDKVVQRYADHFLSVRLFSDFIANH